MGWVGGTEGEHTQNPKPRVPFFWCEPKYPVGVVLTLLWEGPALGRLGVGVRTGAIPRPGAGVTLPTQYYIPDSLGIRVL